MGEELNIFKKLKERFPDADIRSSVDDDESVDFIVSFPDFVNALKVDMSTVRYDVDNFDYFEAAGKEWSFYQGDESQIYTSFDKSELEPESFQETSKDRYTENAQGQDLKELIDTLSPWIDLLDKDINKVIWGIAMANQDSLLLRVVKKIRLEHAKEMKG